MREGGILRLGGRVAENGGVREGDGERQLTTGPINMTKGNLIFQASLVCDKIPRPRGRLLRSPISFHRMTGIL